MTTLEVYVELLDEGVRVWRPVPAHRVDEETYVLLRPEDYDGDDETWQFPPGSVVRCANRRIRDGEILAAVERVAVPSRQSA